MTFRLWITVQPFQGFVGSCFWGDCNIQQPAMCVVPNIVWYPRLAMIPWSTTISESLIAFLETVEDSIHFQHQQCSRDILWFRGMAAMGAGVLWGGGISISLGLPGYTPTSNRSTNIGNLQQHHSMFVKHIRNWIKHLRNANKNTRKLSRKKHWTSTHKTRHPKHILLGESSNDSEDMLWLDHVPALRDGWGAGRKLTIWILLVNPLAQWMFQHGCFVNSENNIELWTALILQMVVEDSWSVVHYLSVI